MSKDMLGSLVRASVNLTQPQINLTLDVINRLVGKDREHWEKSLKIFLRRGLSNELQQRQTLERSILRPLNDNVQIAPVASYDPSEFTTRLGLCVLHDFHLRIGSKAKPIKNLVGITLLSYDLGKDAYDMEIKADRIMPANHMFELESEFVAYLDWMIFKQLNGEKGDLLNDGRWNIFYVADCVTYAYWSSHHRKWTVSTWPLGFGLWSAGSRVFSRN